MTLDASLIFMIAAAVWAAGCAGGSLETFYADAGDAGPGFETGSGGNDTGMSPGQCGASACELGESRCAGASGVVRCIRGSDGCGSFTMPRDCGEGRTCQNGRCVDPANCEDMDGDGFGKGCAKGPDCNDERESINPGAGETCGDEIDNDCNGTPDDGCGVDCSGQPCVPGETRCRGDQVDRCMTDANGCGTWSGPMACPRGAACTGNACPGCTDNDGDGYGAGCGTGPDCDDGDADRHAGAREVCDGKDNDCDMDVDEDFPQKGDSCAAGDGICRESGRKVCNRAGTGVTCDASPGSPEVEKCGDGKDNDCDGQKDEGFGIVGKSCTRGQGVCQTSGQNRCDPNDPTGVVCDAPKPTGGSREICDGKDNDCDGQKDEGGVCNQCVDDQYEQNDGSKSGTPLTSAKTISELNSCGPCGSGWDWDWFYIGNHSPGDRVRIELRHPTGTNGSGQRFANLDIEMYCNAKLCDAIRGTSGRTSGTFDGICANGTRCAGNSRWTFHVYPRCAPSGQPTSGTPYSIKRF